ncbi:MAG TPA: LPS assembly lipoprotein LptE, partial [Acetobacteraceae bacterium]|nr:LPS assembly lipoprotein LptE [Acetobacteraceae bacterium]
SPAVAGEGWGGGSSAPVGNRDGPAVAGEGRGGGISAANSARLHRRTLLPLLALAPLSGCGFRPLYGQGEAGLVTPSVAAELAKIRVAPIGERNGVLLRRALEQRLRTGNEAGSTYELRCGLAFGIDIQGFRRDGVPSRVRTTATANWFLFTAAPPPRAVANGIERTFDAYNIPENQFFAADTSRDAMERRLIEQLADDVVRRLAVVLSTRPAEPTRPA